MKQVKIWIEVCPLGEENKLIAYNDEMEKDKFKLLDKVYEVIDNFCTDDCYNDDFTPLKSGESRETIIQALWEYQKSLLPERCSIDEVIYDFSEYIKDKIRIYENCSYFEPLIHEFYNPETRIITISSFDDDLNREGV